MRVVGSRFAKGKVQGLTNTGSRGLQGLGLYGFDAHFTSVAIEVQAQQFAVLRSQVGGVVGIGRLMVLATLPHLVENAILTAHERSRVGMIGFVRRFDVVGATLRVESMRLVVKDIEAIVVGHVSGQGRMMNDGWLKVY